MPEPARKLRSRFSSLLIFFILTALLAALFILQDSSQDDVTVVAKGGPFFEAVAAVPMTLDEAMARDVAYTALSDQMMGLSSSTGFLSALPLTDGESLAWQAEGCGGANCMLVSFYDYDLGGVVEGIVELDSRRLLASWREQQARPGATAQVVPRALSAAADDPAVSEVLGDIRQSVPMMVPMSIWLEDDDCRNDWCVDLTFAAPDQSGRVFHVVVNMQQGEVARTFYTRSRPERSFTAPEAQGARFNNGCHEQYGWRVCWQMTAHDGVEFTEATYGGQTIFSNAKITQVEVFYPSWPGGYRDEIGHSSSVPPYYGTNVMDLEDGFEVRQLFTEFLRWPNCICCYRYEEIMRFFADGSFEPHFISHGPGCDDLSTYRPFWRFDLDLDGPDNDRVWTWQDGQWREAMEEQRLEAYADHSPAGAAIYTSDESTRYVWTAAASDPLGQDEGVFFLLRWREEEGVGPVDPGPALTFYPPARWLDQEPLSGQNIVIWYIPILKTRQGGPWWCMPDPEPDFSPCDATLRVERIEEDLSLAPTPVATATVIDGAETPKPEATATSTPIPAPTSTPRPIDGQDAETIILNSGCAACHRIGSLGEGGKVGPDLSVIGAVAADRAEGMSPEAFLRQSILEPGAMIAPDCPNGPCMDGIMPADYSTRLTPEQVDTLVAFLLTQTGESRAEPQDTATGDMPPIAPSGPQDEADLSDSQVVVTLLLSLAVLIFLALLTLARRSQQ